jgi:alpha/beta hydrolase fold
MLSVQYRLAPEHPGPAPVEDAYAGLRWLADHAGELGIDPAPAPGRLADTAGLASAYIDVRQLDIFRVEDIRYALKATATASCGACDPPSPRRPQTRRGPPPSPLSGGSTAGEAADADREDQQGALEEVLVIRVEAQQGHGIEAH